MKLHLPSRLCLGTALLALMCAAPAHARWRGPQPAGGAMKPNRPPNRPMARPQARVQKQEHLQQWMDNHSNLSLQDQIRALDNEPGFKLASPQTQQQMRDELVRLHNMPPQQRERLLQRNEELETRTPEQREQFREGMQTYNSLPPNRKMLFKKAFRDLREMPPAQRQSVINSAPFRARFPDSERNALSNVLAVEPYPPVSAAPPEGPQAPSP